MIDDGTDTEHAIPGQWMAILEDGRIVGAFETLEEAGKHYMDNRSVSFRRTPDVVARERCVWGVCTREDQLDSTYGGDAGAATRRAEEIGGEMKLFVAE